MGKGLTYETVEYPRVVALLSPVCAKIWLRFVLQAAKYPCHTVLFKGIPAVVCRFAKWNFKVNTSSVGMSLTVQFP